MKAYIILLGVVVFLSCQENTQTNNAEVASSAQMQSETKQVIDINGKWEITHVSGGPVKIFPGGRKNVGIELDFNRAWKGGVFEFTNGIGFLTIPGVAQDQIGGYEIKGNTLVFEGENDAKQEADFEVNGNEMTFLSPLKVTETPWLKTEAPILKWTYLVLLYFI